MSLAVSSPAPSQHGNMDLIAVAEKGHTLRRPLKTDIHVYSQTLLTRQKDKAEGFHELGCKTIVGNLQDYDLIREECKKVCHIVSHYSQG